MSNSVSQDDGSVKSERSLEMLKSITRNIESMSESEKSRWKQATNKVTKLIWDRFNCEPVQGSTPQQVVITTGVQERTSQDYQAYLETLEIEQSIMR